MVANYLQSGSSDNFGRIMRIQHVTNWIEPEQSFSMCIGEYTCESAVDVAADSHHTGLQRWKAFGKDVGQNLGIGNASTCLDR